MHNAQLWYFPSGNVLKIVDTARKNEPGTKGALPNGRCSDLSEWPGSVSDAAALSARRAPDTPTEAQSGCVTITTALCTHCGEARWRFKLEFVLYFFLVL